MPVQNRPLGYILNPETQNSQEFSNIMVTDKLISVTKSAIQKYLQSFLDPQGENRSFATAILSPHAIQFVTTLSYDDEMKVSPGQRKLYLSRFFAENYGRLPSVLIIDSGAEHVDPGINDLLAATTIGGRWMGAFTFILKINLSIMVATESEEDTDSLASFMMLAFGPLANVVNNYLIRTEGASWEVRLPLVVSPGQPTAVPVEGDSKSVIWTRPLDIQVETETIFGFNQAEPKFSGQLEAAYGPGGPLPTFFNFTPNQAIPLGQPYQLFIKNLRTTHRLAISDPNVALVTMEPPFYLYPKRQGRAILHVFDDSIPLDTRTPQTEDSQRNPQLVMELPFRVVI